MDPDRWRTRANSFGPAAQLYDRIRPSYPVEAIAWALGPLGAGAHRVLDVGAGTGILTRQLVALGHTVLAVEPDNQMRERLAARSPGVTILAGSAEAIPLPDLSVDAGMAAQAYHWFDRARAHPELGRVVRPGGVFAAMWNDRDDSGDWLPNSSWVAEYSRIVERDRGPDGSGADSGRAAVPDYGEGFGAIESAEFRHALPHTPETLVELLKSRSYFLTASPGRQEALEEEVRDLAATHPDLAGRAEFALPYVTVVYRATRLPLPVDH
jgi:SAM-dependent methyltransferase